MLTCTSAIGFQCPSDHTLHRSLSFYSTFRQIFAIADVFVKVAITHVALDVRIQAKPLSVLMAFLDDVCKLAKWYGDIGVP